MSAALPLAERPPLPPPLRPGRRLGRFKLEAVLGRGAQATVWRALDERLHREVALKIFTAEGDAAGTAAWLNEARSVGRLAHPHIVPVFDADTFDGHAALVFELVPGPTLAEVLRRDGAMPARAAVELMLGVVDALRAAHDQGIVHRDLKPSNILIDGAGRARVMDFGIAARLAQPGEDIAGAGMIVGTPGYLSPEAARGAAPAPQMDVFAAGVVLAELLSGARLLREPDVARALQRVQTEDLRLPDDSQADDRLRAVVQHAIARVPADRYESAAALRDALMIWLQPPDDGQPAASAGHGTLDFLLRRMRHKSDFPAMSDRVLRIQRMSSSETETLHRVSDEILKDVALTGKLLKLVNTAHFRRDAQGVSTVSRAVALVGMAGIRNLALSLVLVEHMKDKGHAQRLKESFLRALLAGELAQQLSGVKRDGEEAFLGAMFYNLGPLLAEYYFPDEAEAVRDEIARQQREPRGEAGLHPDLLAERVAQQVLGLGWEALGMGVARHWGLPEVLQQCMRRPTSASPARALPAGGERMRWLAVASNEMAEAVWQGDEQSLPERLEGVAQRHGRALGLAATDLRRAAAEAQRAVMEMAPALGLSVPAARRLMGVGVQPAIAGQRREGDTITAAATLPLEAAVPADAQAQAAARDAAHGLLNAGIQDITDTLAGDAMQLSQVLRMVLETVHRALGCRRVVFCLRDAATGRLRGRFGLGADADALAAQLQIQTTVVAGAAPDLLAAVCQKGNDTLIPSLAEPRVAAALPAWFRQRGERGTCLLLPMMMRGAPFAMIYADHAEALPVGERERASLRTLRNQVVLAFRQAGHGQ
ncbi:protein kinase domain-containing protein [Aquabacterium sp. OR-4]|uniref:protein kinase domain-containing protein n=1 Tax=Aquabacterium sp. OR-4 TaxID=2978127 RepID=UPI0028C5A768|nr:HDOD domain-containing protein [Aquabacterium sp. OR-4]MDT7836674.1 HDOD domain-containing protein [Aquabacterium sp. OR-4]